MQEYKCEVCGKLFKRYACQRKGNHITCSPKCAGVVRGKILKGKMPKNIVAGWNKGKRVWWSGEKHWNWKGGKYQHHEGYVVAYVGDGEYMLEHRHIVEELLGRSLIEGEVVHHINGNKKDNRLQNLEIITNQAEHTKMHEKERDSLGRFLAEKL